MNDSIEQTITDQTRSGGLTACPERRRAESHSRRGALVEKLTPALGLFFFAALLGTYHIADGDLWAKLALGASVWLRGEVPHHDLFAFTPILPQYIDHEWGSGVIFYGLLKWLGASGLMCLKTFLFLGGLGAALSVGKGSGTNRNVLWLLLIPCAFVLVTGFIPTVRSHVFTFCLFGVVLWLLERVRQGSWLAVATGIFVMGIWANVHGGFVAGLGAIAIYTAVALWPRFSSILGLKQGEPGLSARGLPHLLAFGVGSLLISLVNPYGLDYWRYLIPAILHPRARIAEWQPLPLLDLDLYVPFRMLFLVVAGSVALGWAKVKTKSWSGLALLGITAYLGWKSRRHGPFLAVASLAYAGPYFEATLDALRERLQPDRESSTARPRTQDRLGLVAFGIYLALALVAGIWLMPKASWQVYAPVGHDPVREADILMQARIPGNLAVPFGWGSYASWRLFPEVKISNDGRYEAVYPESTFELNNALFEKRGANWDRLIRDYKVDFVILDLKHEKLKPADLLDHGYKLIWTDDETSALMALERHAGQLLAVVKDLAPTTVDPLDPLIPLRWWKNDTGKRLGLASRE